MVRPIPRFLLGSVFSLLYFAGHSQEILNQRLQHVKKEGKNYTIVRITFDLISDDENIPYVVRLKFIDKNTKKSFYLKKVTGDYNKLVYPGVQKQIDWDQQDELVYYRGSPSLELEVNPALQVDRKVKRGNRLVILADSLLLSEETYSIALYRKKTYFGLMEENVKLKATNSIILPKNTPTKKFQLGFVKDDKPFVLSNTFSVKPRVATFWKVLPFIIGAGVAGYIWYDNATEPLPAPPNPTQ